MFKFLFNSTPTVMTMELSVSKENQIFSTIKNGKTIDDRTVIMFSTLFYARLLRVIASSNEKKELAKTFLIWHEELKQKQYFDESYVELMLSTYQVINRPKFALKKTLRIELKKGDVGNYYLDIGVINFDPLSLLAYKSFSFVWYIINKENRKNLLEVFSLISAEFLVRGLSVTSAISLPNQLVSEFLPAN